MYTYRDDRDAESCSVDLRKHVINYILHFKGRCIGCELLNSHMQALFEVDISEDLFKAKKTNIFGSGFNMKMTLCIDKFHCTRVLKKLRKILSFKQKHISSLSILIMN